MSIAEYIEWYILYIPASVYGWGLVAFLAVLLLMMLWKGVAQGVRYASGFLLVEYVALLMYFTVFIRPEKGERELIAEGTRVLIEEHIMNVAVFIPIGILLAIVLKGMRWWKVLLAGMGVSLIVEVMQYIMRRGYCEIDDVIHNSIGCLIGLGLVLLCKMKVNQEKW